MAKGFAAEFAVAENGVGYAVWSLKRGDLPTGSFKSLALSKSTSTMGSAVPRDFRTGQAPCDWLGFARCRAARKSLVRCDWEYAASRRHKSHLRMWAEKPCRLPLLLAEGCVGNEGCCGSRSRLQDFEIEYGVVAFI